ncbi:hypothetical protein AB833_28055 [Chromatiales bacterium (ex Bugula neritina AB1)]|nr:hypothetical protein AB833_28055 [Chromatiales bacterium (ex Bugula neritina AB1)]
MTKFGFDFLNESRQQDQSPDKAAPVPIEMRIEPARLIGDDTRENIDRALRGIAEAVRNGMRATLRQGNLITGALYVSFEPLAGVGEEELTQLGSRYLIPSQASGFDLLTDKVGQTLDQLNETPIDELVAQVQKTMRVTQQTLQQADATLAEFSADSSMYGSLHDSLLQLRTTLNTVDGLANSLKEKPNQLIFSSPRPADKIPRGSVVYSGANQ